MKTFHSIFTTTILACLILTSCKKEEAKPAADYLVFGHFYNECGGERCVEIYKIDTNAQHLYEDIKDLYPSFTNIYEGNYIQLADTLYQQVKDLAEKFPAELLNETNTIIGQPDAGDWGGYYIETRKNGQRRFWLIDTKKENIPSYLHSFIDEVRANIDKLQ